MVRSNRPGSCPGSIHTSCETRHARTLYGSGRQPFFDGYSGCPGEKAHPPGRRNYRSALLAARTILAPLLKIRPEEVANLCQQHGPRANSPRRPMRCVRAGRTPMAKSHSASLSRSCWSSRWPRRTRFALQCRRRNAARPDRCTPTPPSLGQPGRARSCGASLPGVGGRTRSPRRFRCANEEASPVRGSGEVRGSGCSGTGYVRLDGVIGGSFGHVASRALERAPR
jgi:hypothetical protein